MPFTFSHPAIVLPITYLPRQFYSLTGLVIGSMIPDFEYFLRMSVKGEYSHSLLGIFWFDLPLALLIALIYHNLVRNVLINNLPTAIFIRVSQFNNLNWLEHFKSNWIIVLISIVFGIGTHLFWDSFTHENGYFVRIMPALTNKILFFGKHIPIFTILQHLSTLAGGIIIGLFLYHLPKSEQIKQKRTKSYWIIVVILTLIIIVLRLLTGINYRFYENLIISAISAGLIALILTSAWIRIRQLLAI